MIDKRLTAEEYAIQWLEANGLRESPLPDLILSVMVLDELTAKFKSYGDQCAAEAREAALEEAILAAARVYTRRKTVNEIPILADIQNEIRQLVEPSTP